MYSSITNPISAVGFVHDWMSRLDHEEVWAVFLTGNLSIICEMMLSKGTLTQTSIDSRTVVRNALLVNASALILLHNHPSGSPLPSISDITFTGQLKKACSFMDIKLLDHITEEKTFNYGVLEQN